MSAKKSLAVTLRPLESRTDLQAVVLIGQTAFDYPWTEDEYREKLRPWRCPAVVAELDGKVVAWLIAERGRDTFELWSMAVNEQALRAGVGRQLLEWLKQSAAEAGAATIVLKVRERNLAGQKFFAACGFKAGKVLRNFYPQKEDAFVMECAVPGVERRAASPGTGPRIVRIDDDGFID